MKNFYGLGYALLIAVMVAVAVTFARHEVKPQQTQTEATAEPKGSASQDPTVTDTRNTGDGGPGNTTNSTR